MFQRNFSDSGISKEEALLSQEDTLINARGPTLGQFTVPPQSTCIFSEQLGPDAKTCWLRVKNDNNSNIRLFYYCLLCVCFERDCHKQGESYSNRVLSNFKMQVYPQTRRLDHFNCDQIPEEYREHYRDSSLKKVLVEFLQLMKYSQYGVLEMLRRYPIIDTIMILAIRSLLGSATIRYTNIRTQLLADYLHNVIGLKIAKGDKQYSFLGTRIDVLEEEQYSYVIKHQPFLKARRSSLANNYSEAASDTKKSQTWEDIPEIPFNKPVNKPAKVSRLTGLEPAEPASRKLGIQKVKHSMDPTMSLDLDNILVIPKRSFYQQDEGFMSRPGYSDKELEQKAPVQHNMSPMKIHKTYMQAPRMTEDPRMYFPTKTAATSSASNLMKPSTDPQLSSTSTNLDLIKEEFQNVIYQSTPVTNSEPAGKHSDRPKHLASPLSPFSVGSLKSLEVEPQASTMSPKKKPSLRANPFGAPADGLGSPRTPNRELLDKAGEHQVGLPQHNKPKPNPENIQHS